MIQKIALKLGIVLFAAGCGGNTNSGPTIPAGVSEAMSDTHAMLLESSYGGSPLKNAKDADSYAGQFPKAVAAIKSGDIKVVWGKTIKDNPPAPEIIAYEKSAETGEGWAVKDNGKLQKVSSSDIEKLPKKN